MKTKLYLIAAVLTAGVIPAGLASAETPVVGTITYLEGRVDHQTQNGEEFLPSVVGEEISAGDSIRTKSYSKAEISFKDGSMLRLGDSTRITVSDYDVNALEMRDKAVIHLDRGQIRAIVEKGDETNPFEITTPNAVGSVTGSDIFVSFQKSATNVLVAEGTFNSFNPAFPDQKVSITQGLMTNFPYGEPPAAPREFQSFEQERYENATGFVVRETGALAVDPDRESTRATLGRFSGEVQIQKKNSDKWSLPKEGQELLEGDKVMTGKSGRVEIALDNGHLVELRAETQLVVRSLKRDPKTGQYQNVLESPHGRIRARLEKLGKGSTFQIKTPTSVAAVRGTIMYLIIGAEMTKHFFEGGNGYVGNILSGAEQEVPAGNTSTTDTEGDVTEPTETTSEERSEFDSDWGGDSGDTDSYGYSEPDGTEGDETGTGGDEGGGEGGGTPDTGGGEEGGTGQTVFNQVPPTPETTGGTIPQPPVTTTPFIGEVNLEAQGQFGNAGGLDQGEGSGFVNATVGIDFVNNSQGDYWYYGTGEAQVRGTFSKPNANQSLFSADIAQAPEEDGDVVGFLTGAWHSWDGSLSGIYLDPAGSVGWVYGDLAGETDDASGTFDGGGSLFFSPWYFYNSNEIPESLDGIVEQVEIAPVTLESDLYQGIDGSLTARMTGDILRVNDPTLTDYYYYYYQSFGARRAFYDGVVETPYGYFSWYGATGGQSDDGNTYYFGYLQGYDNGLEDGSFYAYDWGYHASLRESGFYYGDGAGFYTMPEAGVYEFDAVTSGQWYGFIEHGFSGYWGEPAGTLFYNNNGDMAFGGFEDGVIGGPSFGWQYGFQYNAVGQFDVEDDFMAYVMSSSMSSFNDFDFTPTTADGGAFFGQTVGLLEDYSLDTFTTLLYMAPDQSIGIMTGAGYGNYETASDAWFNTGYLTPYSYGIEEDIAPEEFIENINRVEIAGAALSGSFDQGVGSIEGSLSNGAYYNVVGYEGWGIFTLSFGAGNTFENPDAFQYYNWNAAVTGFTTGLSEENAFEALHINGEWYDGRIYGTVTGRSLTDTTLGRVDGQFFGLFDQEFEATDGTWIGAAAGSWTYQPLSFNGVVGGDEIPQNLFRVDNGAFQVLGSTTGLIGAAVSPWNGGSDFSAVGELSLSESAENFVWFAPIQSLTPSLESQGTIDGGAFYGWTVSNWQDGEMASSVAGIYLDPSGNAGRLYGYFNGNYSEAIGAWYADGYIYSSFVEFNTSLDPESFFDELVLTNIVAQSLSGEFTDGGQILGQWFLQSVHLDNFDEILGTWAGILGGTYLQNLSGEWNMPFAGFSVNETDPYIMGNAHGFQWSGGSFYGDVTGVWLSDPFPESGGVGLSVGTVTGDIEGTFEIEGEDWQGVGTGEWVEVEELFDVTDLEEITTALENAASFVNLPISEVYSMTDIVGNGAFDAGGTLAAQMDLTQFAVSTPASEGIWAAAIHDGIFTGPVSDAWALDFINGSDIVSLTGTGWSNNTWTADVAGGIGSTALTGTAAGVYQDGEGGGTFQGLATGVWQEAPAGV